MNLGISRFSAAKILSVVLLALTPTAVAFVPAVPIGAAQAATTSAATAGARQEGANTKASG
ncbi:hypothetical protein BH11ACT8_BH11ACT8_19880 [soil metagenome]